MPLPTRPREPFARFELRKVRDRLLPAHGIFELRRSLHTERYAPYGERVMEQKWHNTQRRSTEVHVAGQLASPHVQRAHVENAHVTRLPESPS